MDKIRKNDFIELKYSGYANETLFDSNVEEELKKINPQAKTQKMIVCVGQGMVVPGLDSQLENKEIGKDYEIKIEFKEGFGERRRDLIKTIPLKIFTEKNIAPRAGMVLNMDNTMAKVIAVSGARVIVDFNNPLSGKDLLYKIKIIRKVDDENEKVGFLLEYILKFKPEFEVKDKIVIKGDKYLEVFVKALSENFKKILGKEMVFELKEEKKVEKIDKKDSIKRE